MLKMKLRLHQVRLVSPSAPNFYAKIAAQHLTFWFSPFLFFQAAAPAFLSYMHSTALLGSVQFNMWGLPLEGK